MPSRKHFEAQYYGKPLYILNEETYKCIMALVYHSCFDIELVKCHPVEKDYIIMQMRIIEEEVTGEPRTEY